MFHDHVDQAQRETGRNDLHKPNPYPLRRAAEPFKPYRRVLYVGDTMADQATAVNTGDGVLFVGVYGNVSASLEALKAFTMAGADIVTSTVNDLPRILQAARRGEL